MRRASVSFLIVLLIFLLPSLEGKKKTKTQNKSPNSGVLKTKSGHQCTWETKEEKNNIQLQLSCSSISDVGEDLDSNRYKCQFSGNPNECSAYQEKSAQYWKEVLGKLKKQENACDIGVLKARMCRSAPKAAHMRKINNRKNKKEKEVMMNDEGVRQEFCGERWLGVCHLLQDLLQ